MAIYRPTIKSNFWLGVMALAFIGLYYWADRSRVDVRADNYDLKMEAARTMEQALQVLTDYRLPRVGSAPGRDQSDRLAYVMLGEKDSPITTDMGNIEDKITVLNPNFAAVLVDLLAEAGVGHGDTVAALLTGSMPGANLALYSAAKALGVHLVTITSVGSSWWGANSPDFTWLDMERVLTEAGIFKYRSIAASLGGSEDLGGLWLSEQGKAMIVEAVDRNQVTLIRQNSLAENVDARVRMFESVKPLRSYRAVVNVGGGIAAIGHRENGRLIPDGVNRRLPDRNYPSRGVVHRFAAEGVPVVHVYNVQKLADMFRLPKGRLPAPKPGEGFVFHHEQYNLRVAALALVLMFGVLTLVKYLDRRSFQWREQSAEADLEI